ncbi:MAG: hypothetical protein WB791_03915 [Waddliaceae bacterium]
MPIAFVIYHTDLSEKGVEAIGSTYPATFKLDWPKRWKELQKSFLPHIPEYIDLLFQSTRLCHPDCKCVVLTDRSTSLSLSETIEMHRYDLDRDKPAYMRLLAQRQYLEEAEPSFHILFLDYDMLVQSNLEDITQKEFDVALTHELAYNRINGSFIMIHAERLEKGKHYFDHIKRQFHAQFSRYQAWGGVEAAMNAFLQAEKAAIGGKEIHEVEGIRLMILPCEVYNYPYIQPGVLDFPGYFPDKKILHFRGARKEGMFAYWNTYLKPR